MNISMGKLIGLIKGIAGQGAGGGMQPDWNQNDPTAADYVKNRTHYDATRVLVNKEIEDGDITDSSGTYVKLSDIPFAESELADIVMHGDDGTTVNIPIEGWMVEHGVYAVTELVVNVYVDNAVAFGMTFPTKGVYVASIQEGFTNVVKVVLPNIKTIDPKFLPAGGSGGEFVVKVTGNDTDGYTADKTFAEIEAAYQAGCVLAAEVGAPFGMYHGHLDLVSVGQGYRFCVTYPALDSVIFYTVQIMNNNTVTCKTFACAIT